MHAFRRLQIRFKIVTKLIISYATKNKDTFRGFFCISPYGFYSILVTQRTNQN
jgi:hypothetical protein